MAALEGHFRVDYNMAKSNESAIFQGEKFRITVLSDILVRLEYSESGIFEDRPTEFAIFRNFDVPQFKVEEDDKYLVITTKYFELQYTKGKPFIGPAYAPDSNLKISLVDADKKVWHFNHPEARNYSSIVANLDRSNTGEESSQTDLDKVKKKAKEIFGQTKGLYSTDGFVSIDDSDTMIIEEDGTLKKLDRYNIDTYVFMYRND